MRITESDRTLVDVLGGAVLVGTAFAFVHKALHEKAAFAWMKPLLADAPRGAVISLLGPAPVSLPGATVEPVELPSLSLASVTSDKALYREGRDEAHLLALDPLAPGAEVVLELRLDGADFATRPATLDARGAAAVTLRDLPAGGYEVRLRGAPSSAPACAFDVATYRLAPLVASLVDRKLDGERLAVTLRLESFGAPVDGGVQLELTDRGTRLARVGADARGGVVSATFTLTGEGPHTVNAQLVADPSRTATVPLVGSRAAERSQTTFSTLGYEITGSLLPGEGDTLVRGVYLREGRVRNAPVMLSRVDVTRATMTAVGPLETVRIVVIDPSRPAAHPDAIREVTFDDVPHGKTIELDLPGPMAIVAVGAWADGVPWEGWAATIAPATIAPRLTVPEHAAPGDAVRIEVETGRPADDVSVYLVVKDARLLTPDTPASRLAGGLKAVAEAASKELAEGRPKRTLAEALPPPSYRGDVLYSSASSVDGAVFFGGDETMANIPRPMSRGAGRSSVLEAFGGLAAAVGSVLEPAEAPAQAGPYREAAPPPPAAVQEPEVLFAGLLETRGGRGAVSLLLGPDFADYVVEAFAVAGTDWAPAEARFRAEKEVFAALDLPAFVHPDDAALARLHVGSRAGARVRVTRDGAEVPLLLDGLPLEADQPLAAGRAELSFLAGPGRYEVTLEDGSGVVERSAGEIEAPGKLRRRARTVRFLEPGQSVSRDGDASILGLRVLPGLDAPFTALIDATSDYGHACCEQTAAKMLAACAMYALAGDDRARRGRAEAIILAGVKREASMWLRGRGFKMYPESSEEPNAYWGEKAARYLWNLGLLREMGPSRALAGALDEGLAMAKDTTLAYGLTWPPREPASCEDAYAALRFGKAAEDAALALVRARAAGEGELPATPPRSTFGGAVALRTEAAYAAAALLRAGGAGERSRALALANKVVKDLGPSGRLYSTVDSVAAIALMVELTAAKVVGGAGRVEVDGAVMSTADAVAKTEEIRAVRAVEGVTAVEVSRAIEEDWGVFGAGVPVAVRLLKGKSTTRRLTTLDAVELEVTIESGYKPGDLLWVCLPDALSRVVGGGQVKQFSVDFAGESTARVSLAATGVTVGKSGAGAPARFAVCVRNMFEEERGGSPGFIEVTVAPDGGGVLGRVMAGLKGLFGG